MLQRIALLAIAAPRRILVVALLVMVACGIFGVPVAGTLSAGGFQDPTSESAKATRLLVDEFDQGDMELIISVTDEAGGRAPAARAVGTDIADLDAQGVGTDGFIVFASFDEGLNKGGLAWNEGIIDNSPAYITPLAAGSSTASGGWANYDDVTIGGTTFNTGGITFGSAAGTEAALFAFELSGTIPDSFTVGLLTDNSDNTGMSDMLTYGNNLNELKLPYSMRN